MTARLPHGHGTHDVYQILIAERITSKMNVKNWAKKMYSRLDANITFLRAVSYHTVFRFIRQSWNCLATRKITG